MRSPSALDRARADIKALRSLKEGRFGINAGASHLGSLSNADTWVQEMYQDAKAVGWRDPHITLDHENDVCFEWWHGKRALTVYISPEESWYLKSCGANMSDGNADSSEERRNIWDWLRNIP